MNAMPIREAATYQRNVSYEVDVHQAYANAVVPTILPTATACVVDRYRLLHRYDASCAAVPS